MRVVTVLCAVCALVLSTVSTVASAQTAPMQHDHAAMGGQGWQLTQDGVVFVNVNHQGSPRGGDELAVQNWWMGMAQRRVGSGTLRITLMLSLEPATLGRDGYREIFQSGETLNDFPLVDRQHPHDFLMQGAVVWRTPIGGGYSMTLAGAPVGEPALGPIAFMHRASAFENPTAPLSHHTLDSTHIAMEVITAGVERGPWQVEGSIFHGKEPDEQRWDLMDPGALDSGSIRAWFRPTRRWAFQVSHGFLEEPEASESGDIRRTTASASWIHRRDRGWTAATFAYGRNNEVGGDFNAFLGEATHVFRDVNAIYGRVETLQVEDELLLFGVHGFTGGGRKRHVPESGEGRDYLSAFTLGTTRTLAKPKGFDLGAGADLTLYAVPQALRPIYGGSPVSFHIFFRVRPPAPMGRMIDMTMTR